MVGAITTTKLRVPADIWDVDKCLAWSDEEVEQATVRLDIHTDGQRLRRLLWIPSDGMHTAGESSKATVTCTEFVNQKRRSLTLQQLTQQPESSTLSRKRAPHRSKDPAETPRTDPIVLKRSRPADPVQDPDPAESSVARPKGSAGAALLLAAAVVQDVDESTDDMVAPEGPGEATVIEGTDQPDKAEQKKKRKRKQGEAHKEKRRSKTSAKYRHKGPKRD